MKNNQQLAPQSGEIVLYNPDDTIRLEIRMNDETVWLSQAQMAELFGTQRQAITKHLKNIFESHELDKTATSSIWELLPILTATTHNTDKLLSCGTKNLTTVS